MKRHSFFIIMEFENSENRINFRGNYMFRNTDKQRVY